MTDAAQWQPEVVDAERLSTDERSLAEIGTGLFERLARDAGQADAGPLNLVRLPDGLGVAVVRAVRGGGTIFVAPDGSVLYLASAIDITTGLDVFRDGERTPLSRFD
ncbi:hypothetical protein [Agromyces sp. LHK192]|uniref:hypothetical protein n=1 Tax=Agromyces sp. LHK192 TaxID=2498704 RepID=UPI000FDBDFFD|nr:hypothetical protein [Agromyces sp. LHK192]